MSEPTSVESIREEFEIELVRAGVNANNVNYDILAEVREDFSAKINRLIDEARIDELRGAKGVAHVMMDYTRPILNLSMKPDNPYFRVLATDVEYIENRIKELSNNLKEEQV